MAKRSPRKKTTSKPTSSGAERSSASRPARGGDDLAESLARLHVWQIQAVRDVLFVAAVICIFWAGYALRAVTVPLLVALMLAYLFEPLVARMAQHPKISRPGAVAIILGTVGLAVMVVIALALPLIVGQMIQLRGDLRDGTIRQRVATIQRFVPDPLAEDFTRLLEALPGDEGRAAPWPRAGAAADGETAGDGPVPPAADDADGEPTGAEATRTAEPEPLPEQVYEKLRAEVAEELDELREELRAAVAPDEEASLDRSGLLDIARRGVGAIGLFIAAIVQIGLLAFLIPFYFFFFSVSYPAVASFAGELIPEKNKDHTVTLLRRMDNVVAGFVRGRIVISLIMGVLLAIGWMICGVEYAIALGFVVGIFCAVPYLGVVGIPIAIGFLIYGQLGLPPDERMATWGWFVWPTVVFGAVQLIEGYALTPAIAGKATNLDPVTILVAVLAGGSVLGVYGMLLAIPLAACAKILVTDVLMPRVKAWVRGEVADPLPIERD